MWIPVALKPCTSTVVFICFYMFLLLFELLTSNYWCMECTRARLHCEELAMCTSLAEEFQRRSVSVSVGAVVAKRSEAEKHHRHMEI